MPECHQCFTLMQTQGLRFPSQPRYLSKSPKKKVPPPRFPYGAPALREMLHHQSPLYISLKVPSPEPSLHISRSPRKRNPSPGSPYRATTYRKMLHLQSLLYITLKVPRKETPLRVPLTEPLHRERCSISRAPFTYIQSFQKSSPPPGSLLRVPQKQTLRSQNPPLPVSRSPQCTSPPPSSRFPIRAPMERDAHHQCLLHRSFIKPSKGSPLPATFAL
jgi:hypothetical protein